MRKTSIEFKPGNYIILLGFHFYTGFSLNGAPYVPWLSRPRLLKRLLPQHRVWSQWCLIIIVCSIEYRERLFITAAGTWYWILVWKREIYISIYCNRRVHVIWLNSPQWCAWHLKKDKKIFFLNDTDSFGMEVVPPSTTCPHFPAADVTSDSPTKGHSFVTPSQPFRLYNNINNNNEL